MNYFLKDTIFELVIICLLLFSVELYVDYHPNQFTAKYKEWYSNRNNITTLLVGNSHIQCNINASELGLNACNMAVGGSSLSQTMEMVQTYLPQMIHIKNVIVNFDYYHVYNTPNESADNKQELSTRPVNENWIHYMNYIHHRYLHIGSSLSRFDFAITCNQFHFNIFHTNYLTDLDLDKMNQDFIDNPCQKIEKIPLKYYLAQVDKIVAVAEIVEKKNARLIVVTPPVYGKYYEQLYFKNIKLMNTTMDSLSQLYPIEYKNYLSDTCFMHDYLFMDNNHLNRRGASLFTHRIKEDFRL